MKKLDKELFVNNLTKELKTASSVVLVDYTGLSVALQQDLKKKLKEVGAKMSVSKNTLFKIAATEAKYPEEALTDSALAGPAALVITEDDPIAPLQIIAKFAKENSIPNLKVGIMEGSFQDKSELEVLSKLPSKAALAGQVVGAISAPLYGIVGVLNANMQKLLFILSEHSKSEAQSTKS